MHGGNVGSFSMRTSIWLALLVVWPAFMTSCERRIESRKEVFSIENLSSISGLKFPADARIIREKGGERDASYDYSEWIVFSKDRIEIPPAEGMDKQQGGGPVQTKIDVMEESLGKGILQAPRSVSSWYWDIGGYQLYGISIEDNSGFYLRLTAMKK